MTTKGRGPTFDEIATEWPATVDVGQAGKAFGISKSHSYDLVNRGAFPARCIKVGGRWRVLTSSIVSVLAGEQSQGKKAA